MLADRRYCYPLTISDFASRYLFSCEALASTKETYAFTIFEQVVKDFGLPTAIRTDNGVPFASPHALLRLEQARRVVAAAGHPHRAHQARPPRSEWPP
jgi:putative transposase